MSETLIIDVDVPTHRAVETLQQLTQGLEQVDAAVAQADVKIEKVEKSIEEIGRAASGAATSVEAFGKKTESATYDVVEIGNAVLSAGEKLKDMETKYEGVGNMGLVAMTKAEQATKKTADASTSLISKIGGIGTAYMALNAAVELMRELERQTLAVLAAKDKLAGKSLDSYEALQPLLLNMGLQNNQANQDRVRALATEFQRQVGNKDVALTSEILSAFANSGFDVADSSKDGFKMAVQAGIFAQRTGMSGEAAALMARQAASSGAKTPADMQRLIAQREAGFQGSPVPHTTEYQNAAANTTTSMAALGVDQPQALGIFGAATTGEVDASVAASRVKEVVIGLNPAEPQQQYQLGKSAREAGLISDSQIAAGKDLYRQLHPTYDAKRQQAQTIAADRAKRAQDAYDRLKENTEAGRGREETAIADEEAKLAAEESHPHKSKNRAADEARRKAQHDALAARRESLKRNRSEDTDRLDDAKRRAADAKLHLDTEVKVVEQELEMSAYGYALKSVPMAQKLELLKGMMKGKTPEQQNEMLSRFMPAGTVANVLPIFSQHGRETWEQIEKNAGAATAQQTQAANVAYAGTKVATDARANAAAQQQEIAAGEGEEYGRGLIVRADARILEARKRGKAQVGGTTTTLFKQHDNDLERQTDSEEGQQARYGVRELRGDIEGLWASMTPEQRARHPELQEMIGDDPKKPFPRAEGRIFAGATLMGPSSLASLAVLARQFGAVRAKIKEDARARGESVPGSGGTEDPSIPAPSPASTPLPPGAVRTGQTFGPASRSTPAPATRSSAPVVIYNSTHHYANLFSGGGGEDDNLPGRFDVGGH